MSRARVFSAVGLVCGTAVLSGIAHGQGAAIIDQVPTTVARPLPARAPAHGPAARRTSATDKIAPPISPEQLAVCQAAQAADRPAPPGIDCVRALQVTAAQERQNAEGSLLDLFGQSSNRSAPVTGSGGGSVSAEQVSRQLSSGDFQGTAGSDAAASVARERAPPQQTTPPPR